MIINILCRLRHNTIICLPRNLTNVGTLARFLHVPGEVTILKGIVLIACLMVELTRCYHNQYADAINGGTVCTQSLQE